MRSGAAVVLDFVPLVLRMPLFRIMILNVFVSYKHLARFTVVDGAPILVYTDVLAHDRPPLCVVLPAKARKGVTGAEWSIHKVAIPSGVE